MTMYSQFLGGVLLPAYDRLLGRKQSEYRALTEKSQWWSADELLAFQWSGLKKLLAHAFENVSFYREKYGAEGIRPEDIRTPADFARLPILTRQDIKTYRDRLRAQSFTQPLIEHATGGSSGVPMRFFITRDSFEWRCAVSERAYSWTGCRLGDRTMYLWGAPVGKPKKSSSIKLQLFRGLRRECMFNTFSQSDELWETVREKTNRWRPELLVGYVSSLEAFSRYLMKSGRTVKGIRAAIAAAEPVHSSSRTLIESAIGAPLYNTYGSREFMSVAAECEHHDGLHIHMENLLVETESRSTTEPSSILITDLHNYGMPFIRYAIGDLAIMQNGECACGRKLQRIRSIEGRELDALRTADGRIVPGEFFPHMIKEVPEIREFQVRQESLDRIVLAVVLQEELSERSSSLIRSEFRKLFREGTELVVDRVTEISRLQSGKRRVTIGLPPESWKAAHSANAQESSHS